MKDVYADILLNYSKVFRERLATSTDRLLLFGVYQALYRLFAAGNSQYSVLHASAAVSSNGSCVVFGDDGVRTKGKTFCALELAIASGKFISDEYVLFRNRDNHIFGNGHIPINLKGETADHFKNRHDLQLATKPALFANDHFAIVPEAVVDFMIVPYLGAAQTELSLPTKSVQAELYKATTFGHLAKLLNPALDRVSILTEEDTDKGVDMQEALKKFDNVEPPFPAYIARLKNPCDISGLVEEIENGR